MLKNKILSFFFFVSMAHAYITEDQGEYLRKISSEKYEQFFNDEEVQINVTDLALLMLRINREVSIKISQNEPLFYNDVQNVMTYDSYIKFIPRYIEWCKYNKWWTNFMKELALVQGIGMAQGFFEVGKIYQPDEYKNGKMKFFFKKVLLGSLVSMGVGILAEVLLKKFKHKKHVERCTVTIKNLSQSEIARNNIESKKAFDAISYSLEIKNISSDKEQIIIEVITKYVDRDCDEILKLIKDTSLTLENVDIELAISILNELNEEGIHEIIILKKLNEDGRLILSQYSM